MTIELNYLGQKNNSNRLINIANTVSQTSHISKINSQLFTKGIELVPEELASKRDTNYFLKKSNNFHNKAEVLSAEIQLVQNIITELKNPEILDSILLKKLLNDTPKKLKQDIKRCFLKTFPSEGLEKLRSNPRLLLQMKDSQGRTIIDHFLMQHQQKLVNTNSLAELYHSLSSPEITANQEVIYFEYIHMLKTPSKSLSTQFHLKYILSEGVREHDRIQTTHNIFKLQQLQEFYYFLKTSDYSKEFIFTKFQALDSEIQTALGEAVWIACYKPDKLFFADRLLSINPRILLECNNSADVNIIVQLMDYYKSKIILQRLKQELIDFGNKLKNTSDKEEQLLWFNHLPEFAKNDLSHLVWLEHGGRKNPTFSIWGYGEQQIKANPVVLNQLSPFFHIPTILELYIKQIDQDIDFNICQEARHFANQMNESIDCSATRLASGEIPAHMKVVMITAEFSGVISIGGLAPAVEGMARSYGTDDVYIILPKYDVINANLVLQEKEKYQINFNGQIHKVFKTKVKEITCLLIEDGLFNMGWDNEGKPNNIYEGNDVQVKRRWAHFQSLSAELAYQLSQKEKEPVQLIHVHDAQTALVPKILSTRHYEEWKEGKTPATVFTFHNNNCPLPLDYHETIQLLPEIGLPASPINSFIEGLKYSDMNTTVSKTFAKEVQTSSYGRGMQMYTKTYAFIGKIAGIVNGNSNGWNPKIDPQLKNWITRNGEVIDLSYGPEDKDLPEKIKLIRKELVEYLNFHKLGNFDPQKPIFLYVGRYDAYQKGIDKLPIIMEEALKNGAQFICIGLEPDSKAHGILSAMEAFAQKQSYEGVAIIRDFKRPDDGRLYWQQGNTSPDDLSGVPGFGSLLRAGIDIGIFPSMFEPCGLVQGEMHRMGIETVATATGGFMDTIFPSGPNRNGYLFPRFPNWESIEQDEAIRQTVQISIKSQQIKLNALYSENDDELSPFIEQKRTIMINGARSSWTSTFDGSLSPIDRIKLAYAQAEKNRQNREILFPIFTI